MIVDTRGIIQKLDTKSVVEYCKQLTVPLVLYGMGENGQFTYQILKSNGIVVQALADGDPQKQNTTIDQLTITSWHDALERYPNAVVWICIANKKIRNQVIDDIHDGGYNPYFLTFNLKYPMDQSYYRDWDQTLPCVIMGKGNALLSAYQILKKNHCIVSLIVSTDKNDKLRYEEKIQTFSMDMSLPKNSNYILCDETKWNEMINTLHNIGICECIYRQITGMMGAFDPKHYTFTNRILRETALSVFLELNRVNQAMEDETSKQIFRSLVQNFILTFKSQNKIEDEKDLLYILNFIEENRNIKEYFLGNRKISISEMKEVWSLHQLETDIITFLNMFKMIYTNYLADDKIKYRLFKNEKTLNIQIVGREKTC